ncbi:MAG TPA: tryptophan--tRNA ligase [Thermoplasmatales archaeon]|nr:tryptophan--tRNA ligase [Thermoplasmatales archaeon]
MVEINPWSSKIYEDYGKLMKDFGIEEFNKEIWKDLPNPHRLIRRGIVFGHRDFDRVKRAIVEKKRWAILTGLMPSGKMHLGHKMVIDQVKYYQDLGADIFIAVADIEAYATRNVSLKEAEKIALEEYIPYYIALGLDPEKSQVYFQSKRNEVKDLAYIFGKKVNWSQLMATYGFDSSTNMSHAFAPLIQTGDILHVQLEKFGGVRPTLVPVGIDQDPHLRLCRDISRSFRFFNVEKTSNGRVGIFFKLDTDVKRYLDCAENVLIDLEIDKIKRIDDYKAIYLEEGDIDLEKIDEEISKMEVKEGGYGFLQPSSTYHRLMTGLDGEKMSSSRPQSAIFLSDDEETVRKKVFSAKTGGRVSLEEQRRYGGEPEKCMIYELFLYHLIENEDELKEIYNNCRNGELKCGDCKKLATRILTDMLKEIMEKKGSKDEIKKIIAN